jgi:hypothetical protein
MWLHEKSHMKGEVFLLIIPLPLFVHMVSTTTQKTAVIRLHTGQLSAKGISIVVNTMD